MTWNEYRLKVHPSCSEFWCLVYQDNVDYYNDDDKDESSSDDGKNEEDDDDKTVHEEL